MKKCKELLVFMVIITMLISGCGTTVENNLTFDSSELFLLDESEPFSVWWEGTPGSDNLQINVSELDTAIKKEFFILNNSEEKLILNIKCDNIENVKLTNKKIKIDPGESFKSSIEFDPSFAKRKDDILGAIGPVINLSCTSSGTEKSLAICVLQNDPDLKIEWEETKNYPDLDYTDKIKKSFKVTNTSEKNRKYKIFQITHYKDKFCPLGLEAINIKPGETKTHDYEIFYPYCECDDNHNYYAVFVQSGDDYFFGNQIYTKLADCQDWELTWINKPESKNLYLNIDSVKSYSFEIEIRNPCDHPRVFRPEKIDYLPFIISFEKEGYPIPANSSMKANLLIENFYNESLRRNNVIDLNFHDDYDLTYKEPCTLTINYNPEVKGDIVAEEIFTAYDEDKYPHTGVRYTLTLEDKFIISQAERSYCPILNIDPNRPQFMCFDTNTFELLWSCEKENINGIGWAEVFDGKLYIYCGIKNPGNDRGAGGFDAFDRGKFICVDIDSGKTDWESEDVGFCYGKILLIPNDGLYYNSEPFDIDEVQEYTRFDLETGEKLEVSKKITEWVLTNHHDGSEIIIDDNPRLWDFELESEYIGNVVMKCTSETPETTIWETPIKHYYISMLCSNSFSNGSNIPAFWKTEGDECGGWFSCGEGFEYDKDYLYYIFSDKPDICGERCGEESPITIKFDGVGCIDRKTGKIVWESIEAGHLCPTHNYRNISVFKDFIFTLGKYYRKSDGKIIEDPEIPIEEKTKKYYWQPVRRGDNSKPNGFGIISKFHTVRNGDGKTYTYFKEFYFSEEEEPFCRVLDTNYNIVAWVSIPHKNILVVFGKDKIQFIRVPKKEG